MRERPSAGCLADASVPAHTAIESFVMREFTFEQDLVRALLQDQHPEFACLELRDVEGGWDNQRWRLGEELAVRWPRTGRAPALLRTEQTWLPVLANRLPLPTPVPGRIGTPSNLFEHTWTIARWVEGEPAADAAPARWLSCPRGRSQPTPR